MTDSRWVDHANDEIIAEPPHLQRDLDGYQRKDDLEPSHPAYSRVESLDVLLVLLDELGREEVGPELQVSESATAFDKFRCRVTTRGGPVVREGEARPVDSPCPPCRTILADRPLMTISMT